mmetsp:Transcript_19079/g.41124  ORF Transcript_19079/g.41124 Transcript_19079/m.41124 type:complete len:542 (-) Transcript_19079:134-1759(-)
MEHTRQDLEPIVKEARARPGLLAVIDNSNIFIMGKVAAGRRLKLPNNQEDPSWRLSFQRLYELITRSAPSIAKVVLFGSLPPPSDEVWNRCEEGNISVCLSHRKKHGKKKEMEVDNKVTALLAADLGACSARQAGSSRSYCLVGGDRDYSVSVRHCLQAGFQVTLWAWKGALAREYKKLEDEYKPSFRIELLDDHLDFVGFSQSSSAGLVTEVLSPAALPSQSTIAFFSTIVAGGSGKKKRAQARASIDRFVSGLPLDCWRQELQGGHTLVIFQDLVSLKTSRYWRWAAAKLLEQQDLQGSLEVLSLRKFLEQNPSLQLASPTHEHRLPLPQCQGAVDDARNDDDDDDDDGESTEDDGNDESGKSSFSGDDSRMGCQQQQTHQAVRKRVKNYPFGGSVSQLEVFFDNFSPEEVPLPGDGSTVRCLYRELCSKGIQCTYWHSEREKDMFKCHGGVPPFLAQKQYFCNYHTDPNAKLTKETLRRCPYLHPSEEKLCCNCLQAPCGHPHGPEQCALEDNLRPILTSAKSPRAKQLMSSGHLKAK